MNVQAALDASTTVAEAGDELTVELEAGERWWGGAVADATVMPFDACTRIERDLSWQSGTLGPDIGQQNQTAPVLVSSHGRVVGSRQPFAFAFDGGTLRVTGDGIELARAGSTLRDGYRAAARRYFPPSGLAPARELFTGPQYNTWIELPYVPTQRGVLNYARGLLDEGLPPGVVMIDDCWSPDYGVWRFDPARFPDPAGMVDQLHAWGCPVMLWVVPFVSPDSATFRELEARGLLVRGQNGETVARRWWNGLSAMLDLSYPDAVSWFCGELDALVEQTGVDGFKFDAGDLSHYRPDDVTAGSFTPVEMCEAWARIGLRYPFNEYRACWRMGGQPLAQRVHDKPPSWGPDGIGSLIPTLVAQGLIGHAFSCPDMVGGGELGAMSDVTRVDQEFVVRYAQVAALAPMMQFSQSPARVLDDEHRAAVARAVAIRQESLPLILGLVDHAAETGEPLIRPMAYHEPGLEGVTDQFSLGSDLVVAPVIEQGATTRRIHVPAGEWELDDGTQVSGPSTVTVLTPLDRIPRLRRLGH